MRPAAPPRLRWPRGLLASWPISLVGHIGHGGLRLHGALRLLAGGNTPSAALSCQCFSAKLAPMPRSGAMTPPTLARSFP